MKEESLKMNNSTFMGNIIQGNTTGDVKAHIESSQQHIHLSE